jgi:hypothetical protein
MYFFGHGVQAASNLYGYFERKETFQDKYQSLADELRARLASESGLALSLRLDFRQTCGFAHSLITQFGIANDHDLFTYREGFYRGSSTSFMLLGISTLVRACVRGAFLHTSISLSPLPPSLLISLAGLELLIAYAFYRRFRRFQSHKFNELLTTAILLSSKAKTDSSDNMEEEK